ncbi:MAG: sigma 54-interacting transcriptional regulator [Deltaproteobacteria bacterium]|nr:sigma 54-interacting transcriptional regulator [Deltaproteobacteria bacterium]
MGASSASVSQEKMRLERDFYRRLLELSVQTEIEPFLKEALALVIEVAGAQCGYLELLGPAEGVEQRWSLAHGFSDEETEAVRSQISTGIIAEALSTGTIVDTASAIQDPRFLERKSVQIAGIEAVLCVPIENDPPLGALYLQGRRAPGAFTEEDCERAKLFARHLAPLVDNLVLRSQMQKPQDATAPFRHKLRAESLIGSSPALAALLRDLSLVAPLEVNVLLTGESGSGKTRIARVIHESGPRANGAMVEVNCAALPEGLVESELFGARAGSHSTATAPRAGKVAAAEGGTLLLDEISEMPLGAQSKLLQLLQTKQYYPLGANEPVTADMRLIAATNIDLEAAVRDGRFRQDLLYRLVVLPIRVPSLAERRSDLPELARHFCAGACERHHLQRLELSGGALRSIEAAEWPGNIRQLENAIEAGVIRAAGMGTSQVEQRHIFPHGDDGEPQAEDSVTFQEATRRFQAKLLLETLEETGWNVSEAARSLDLARSHVYKLIGVFGIERGR